MPSLMPSLFKYFVTIGAILFVGLIGLNAVMEPGGPGLRVVQDSPKAKLVRHDPRASLVERLRECGFALFDIQFLTPHTARLGGVEIPRAEYLARLKDALGLPATFA